MTDNPHTSSTFTDIWFAHFNKSGSRTKIDGIHGVEFFKDNKGILVNAGLTHTKGITYQLKGAPTIGGKTMLVCDVPTYLDISILEEELKGITIKRIRQYPGYLIELDKFTDLDDFMRQKFKKSSRYKLNKYKRRLTECFDISYHMYTGDMDPLQFSKIFDQFRNLLEKRFEDKGEYNNNLDEGEWEFYKKVALPMMKENKAGLFVVFDHGEPIAITLNYFSEDIIFDAITVFDIDYAKFHLGSVNIMFLVEWGLNNGYKILDFSKGQYDYKERWATKKYDFEYHILHNPSSPISSFKSKMLINSFKTKQYLREKGLNLIFNKIRYRLIGNKHGSSGSGNSNQSNVVFEDCGSMVPNREKVDGYAPNIKRALFEFLYLFGESAKDVEVFKGSNDDCQYIFQGKNVCKSSILT